MDHVSEQATLQQKSTAPRVVVGVGASAGGLEALETLLDGLSQSTDFAYLVVTHLSPDFKSLLDELLARRTEMPVHLVEDGMVMEGGAIYVLPPKKDMIVAGERLYLRDRDSADHPPVPIDTLFRSIAREWGPNAIGVVLSGTGTDGSRGIRDIKKSGGIVLAQEPSSARFSGMPKSAIETGFVDEIAAPRAMGAAIEEIGATRTNPELAAPPDDDDDAALQRIVTAVFGVSEIDFSGYKYSTFVRRVQRRMNSMSIESIVDYARAIEADPEEGQRLSDDLLIGVTDFFRDQEAYDKLLEIVLSELVEEHAREGTPLRIWTAGCATGQEAYSLAIMVREAGRTLNKHVAAQIFATDIQQKYLDQASRGVYSAEELKNLDPELLRRHFTPVEDKYKIKPILRQWVVFAQHDFLRDPPFTRVDLIVCRNALIYINPDVQQRIIALFHFALNSKGALFLGPSESLGELEREFTVLDGRWRIYRKTHDRPLHVGPTVSALTGGGGKSRPDGSVHRVVARRKEAALMPAYNAMLARFAPASALVTTDRELLHTFGDARRFLHPPSGVTNLDIINMVDSGLRTPLATGIERCLREHQEIVFPDLPVRDDDTGNHIRLRIVPLTDVADGIVHHVLVILDTRENPQNGDAATVIDLPTEAISRERIDELELELKRTRETLQATIEEVETSNEELQSANEELMAANEELQSTNEELNSVNEELYSVNAEYQRQNQELIALNADMESLLRATDIGVIFVDEQLTIRRCTSAASRLFNIIADDVGRRLGHISHRFVEFDAEAFIEESLSGADPTEKELLSRDGDWWLLRCVPHDFSGGGGRGAVLTVVNIDRLKSAELEATAGERRYRQTAELAGAIYVEFSVDGKMHANQSEWENFTGQTGLEYVGDGWLNAVHSDDRQRVARLWSETIGAANGMDAAFRVRRGESKDWRHMRGVASPNRDVNNQIVSWSAVLIDIEAAIQAETVVRKSEETLKVVMSASPSVISYIGADRRFKYVNNKFESAWGVPTADVVGALIEEALPKDIYQVSEPHIARALDGKRSEFFVDRSLGDGQSQMLLVICEPHVDRNDTVLGFAINCRDVTHLRSEIERRDSFQSLVSRVVDELGNDLIVFDPETLKIEHVNRRGRKRLEHTLDDLRTMQVSDLTPSISEKKWRKLVGEAESDEDARPSIEAFLITRTGETYDCDIEVRCLRDNKRHHGVLIAVDIGHRLEVARSLRQRTAELAASNRDLEQFASAASHDLRAPLRHIAHFAGEVLEDHADTLPDDARDNLSIVVSRAARLQDMVTSLLEYSRLSRTKTEFSDISLGDVVRQTFEDLSIDLAQLDADFEIGEMPVVRGELSLIERLFHNLIDNAIKYADEKPLKIKVDCVEHQAVYRVGVADNGIGISKEFAERIFEIFKRLHPSDEREGLGIGLSLCRRIMEMHGGRIWLDTDYEDGARFVLDFPRP